MDDIPEILRKRSLEIVKKNSEDEGYLKPEYMDASRYVESNKTRVERLENSVRALLRRSAEREAIRMIRERAEFPGEHRRTSERVPVTFDKEELEFLLAVMTAISAGEIMMGNRALVIADHLRNEFASVHRDWRTEAENNGEQF